MEQKKSMLPFMIVLGTLSAFGPLSLDMYLPALPRLAEQLNTSTSLVQLSLTACLLGLSIGQIFAGPISDVRGRRKPLIIGLILYAVMSLVCAYSPSIEVLIVARFVQGLAGAAGLVISRAVVRDLFEGPAMTKFAASLMLINGAAPILAPIAGGQLLNFTTWRGIFVVLSLIGVAVLIAVVAILPETLPAERRAKAGVANMLKAIGAIARDRQFLGYALASSFVLAGMFAYIAGSPFVIQDLYGGSPQLFSLIFGINGVGIIAAGQIAGRLAGRVADEKMLRIGLAYALFGGISLLTVIQLDLGLVGILPALFIVVSAVGLVSTASFALSMKNYGHSAGSASALSGLISFSMGGIAAPLVGLGGSETALPLGIVVLGAEVLAILAYVVLARRSVR